MVGDLFILQGRHFLDEAAQAALLDDAQQHGLQSLQGFLTGEVQRVEPGVPLRDPGEQGDGGDQRHRYGEVDPPEDAEVAGAVDARRVLQRDRQVVEAGHHDDDVEEREQLRKDVDPEGVQQPEKPEVEVDRNQAAGKEQRNGEDHQVPVTKRQVGLAQRECAHRAVEHREHGADHGPGRRRRERGQQAIVGEDHLVVSEREVRGEQVRGTGVELDVHGVDQVVVERIDDGDAEHHERRVDPDVHQRRDSPVVGEDPVRSS